MIGEPALIGGVLELAVPSYALRLIRRYGTERLGWFVVIIFSSLALLHLAAPLIPAGGRDGWAAFPDLIYAVGSVLLLIGLGHSATLLDDRERTKRSEVSLKSSCELRIQQEGADLARANEELLGQIAAREEVEKTLHQAATHYQLLFADNPHPMWIVDLRSSQFLGVNQAALRLYGFSGEEFAALAVRDLVSPVSLSPFLQFVAQAAPGARGEWLHYRKDGTALEVEITAADLQVAGNSTRLVLIRDIGPERQRAAGTFQARKMKLIGGMAGGIAHHINNILTIIQGYTSIMLNETQSPKTATSLNNISAAVTRAAGITRQLLVAGSRHSMELRPLDLNGVIHALADKLRRLPGEKIVLQNDCGKSAAFVLADHELIECIVVNLVMNARDATAAGGTITINTTALCLEAEGPAGGESRRGNFVRLTVRDTGCGMPVEVQARLFEPFFTTKDIGQGLGLGLASVYGAVRQQSGWIEFTSEVGRGTEFRVFLPAAPSTPPVEAAGATAVPAGYKGTLLLVEPDSRVRTQTRCILDWNGYRVIETDNPLTALMLWESGASSVDLLLTDVAPSAEMSGPALARRLMEARPGLKVLYTSCSDAHLAASEVTTTLLKPYSSQALIHAVRSCLSIK